MTSPMKLRALVASAAAVLALTGAVAADAGTKRVKLGGERTTITPSAGVTKALSDNGVSVSLLGKATAGPGGAVVLPITGGRVNPQNLRGFVLHAGGVKFTKGARSLRLRRFVIHSTKRGAFLTVHASGKRKCAKHARKGKRRGVHGKRRGVRGKRCGRGARHVVLARLSGAQRSDAGGVTTVTARLTLTKGAARLLNRRLKATVAQPGAHLGTVKIEAKPAS